MSTSRKRDLNVPISAATILLKMMVTLIMMLMTIIMSYLMLIMLMMFIIYEDDDEDVEEEDEGDSITRNRRHFAPAKYLARGFKLSRWRHKESIKKAVDRKNKD